MALVDLQLDPSTWSAGSPARQAEWRAAIVDLIDDGRLGTSAAPYLLVTRGEDGVLFEYLDEDGHARAAHAIARAAVQPHIDSYVDVIRRMRSDDS